MRGLRVRNIRSRRSHSVSRNRCFCEPCFPPWELKAPKAPPTPQEGCLLVQEEGQGTVPSVYKESQLEHRKLANGFRTWRDTTSWRKKRRKICKGCSVILTDKSVVMEEMCFFEIQQKNLGIILKLVYKKPFQSTWT